LALQGDAAGDVGAQSAINSTGTREGKRRATCRRASLQHVFPVKLVRGDSDCTRHGSQLTCYEGVN